jgi:FlaA1/EpsC-like NDP-sugar epimerase
MQLFNRYVSPRGLTVFGLEILLISGSVSIAARAHGADANVVADLWKIALVTGLCQVCFYYNDLYDLTVVHSTRELLIRLLQAAGAASIIIAFLYLVMPSLAIGNGIFVSSLVIFLAAIITWRLIFLRFTSSSQLDERILMVGTGPTARTIARQIQGQHDFGYRVVGFVDENTDNLLQLVHDRAVDRIVVAVSDRRGRLPLGELLEAKLSGIEVEDATTIYERLTGKILIDDLKPSWCRKRRACSSARSTSCSRRSS